MSKKRKSYTRRSNRRSSSKRISGSGNKVSNADITGWGCLIGIVLVIYAIGELVDYINASLKTVNWGKVIGISALVILILTLIWFIRSGDKKGEFANDAGTVKKSDKRRNLEIFNAQENKPNRPIVCTSMDFANKEEEKINLEFRTYTEWNSNIIIAKSHVTFLENKRNAAMALRKKRDASKLSEEIERWNTAVTNATVNRSHTFESSWVNAFYGVEEIKRAYSLLARQLPNDSVAWAGAFFQSPKVRMVAVPTIAAMIFTPLYVVYYRGTERTLKLVPYSDVSVSASIYTEVCEGALKEYDEVERVGFRYANADGTRDRRYSTTNNPYITIVYRGKVKITALGISAVLHFKNRTYTYEFEKNFNEYVRLLSQEKYRTVISKLIAHNDEVSTTEKTNTLINQYNYEQEKSKRNANTTERKSASPNNNSTVTKQEEHKPNAPRNNPTATKQDENRASASLNNATATKQGENKFNTTWNNTATTRQEERKQASSWNNTTATKQTVNKTEQKVERSSAEHPNSEFVVANGVIVDWKGQTRQVAIEKGIATAIGTAFRKRYHIRAVTIPEGIMTIQASAFQSCADLVSLELPKEMKSIGNGAFESCFSLPQVELPKGITELSDRLFAECSALKKIVVPEGVKRIGKQAFLNCVALEEIVLPDGVEIVDDAAFYNCSKLERVVFPDTVVKLGTSVFDGCASISHVSFGYGITNIPGNCFKYHKNLQYVMVSESLSEIGESAFKECINLKSLTLIRKNDGCKKEDEVAFSSLKVVGKSAFDGCVNLEKIDFGKNVLLIDERAFANCKKLKKIRLTKGIDIGVEAFHGCASLSEVDGIEYVMWHGKHCFDGAPWLETQAEDGCVIHNGYLETYAGKEDQVVIPSSVRTIGCYSFAGNNTIVSVTIPSSVTTIDQRAFSNCKNLVMVKIPDSVKSIHDSAFYGASKVVIQCTRGSVASAFRIRNKLLGEYISKTAAEEEAKQQARKKGNRSTDEMLGLSEEERQLIMELRRKKHEQTQRKTVEEPATEQTQKNYQIVAEDESRISLELMDDSRKITNNIFNLRFCQNEPAGSTKTVAEYEAFVIDSSDQIISDTKIITTDLTGDNLVHKVSFALSAQEKFDKAAAYYVVVRYKGSGTDVLSKTQYQISIDFASDFDF